MSSDGRTRFKNCSVEALSVDCVYCSDGGRSVEELVALTEPSLQVHGMTTEDELQFALTQFVVHGKHGLCSLEDAAIEKGQEVFVCGLLRKLVDDDEEEKEEVGLPVKKIGTDLTKNLF